MNQKNIHRLHVKINKISETSRRLSLARVILFVLALVFWGMVGTKVYAETAFALGVLTVLVFLFLVRQHNKVKRALALFKGRLEVENRQQSMRLLEWSRLAPWGNFSEEKMLPYLTDLNIVGEFSFLRLINQTVSLAGKARLFNFFLSNDIADEEIQRRGDTVRELLRMKSMRNIFLSHVQANNEPIDTRRIALLLNESLSTLGTAWQFIFIAVFQIMLVGGLISSLFTGQNGLVLVGLILVLVENMRLRKKLNTASAYGWALSAAVSLDSFRAAIAVLEKYSSTNKPHLSKILEPFKSDRSASQYIKKLETTAGALGTRQNFIVHGLLHLFFPWDIAWTYRLEGLRKKIQKDLPHWENSLAEFEVFLSLSCFAAVHPEFKFAELKKDADVIVEAEDLRHPMILQHVAIGNPLRIDNQEKCILITGSNMSGKSTFLRSAGLNFLLAKTGLPVAATRFVFANKPLMTSLSAADSLHEGLSSFYAEVRRLKNILEVAQQPRSVFFLVDEIFRGTNNRERFLGSQAYIKEIVSVGGKGMVTSHDLELSQLENLGIGIMNYHFKESIVGAEMSFSYKKNRGPCPTTNALLVMKLNGLPVNS